MIKKIAECVLTTDSAVHTPMNFGIYILIFGATMAAAWVLANGRHV